MNTGQQATRVNSPLARGGGMIVGRQRTLTPGERARAQEKPLLPGQVRCDTCGNGAPTRTDGSMKAHQAERYVQCAGAPSRHRGAGRDDLCDHGNYPSQRQQCCGTTVQGGQVPTPVPEHLRRFV